MGIHRHIYTLNGPMNNRSILQLYRHRLMTELHQKPNQLHFNAGMAGMEFSSKVYADVRFQKLILI
jgi:hypothetical protein